MTRPLRLIRISPSVLNVASISSSDSPLTNEAMKRISAMIDEASEGVPIEQMSEAQLTKFADNLNREVMKVFDEVNADNWAGIHPNTGEGPLPGGDISGIRSDSPFDISYNGSYIDVQSAQEAYESVLSHAGASLVRDDVDGRIIEETRQGTFTYTGSKGSKHGIIDSQNDVGGWPSYESGEPWTDTDGDGMPDEWEDHFGLSKTNPADGSAKTLDPTGRYTNLELWLHYLVKDIIN